MPDLFPEIVLPLIQTALHGSDLSLEGIRLDDRGRDHTHGFLQGLADRLLLKPALHTQDDPVVQYGTVEPFYIIRQDILPPLKRR
jgi:hypothetical protein